MTIAKLPKIIDTVDLQNQGIIFKDQTVLQEIYKQSGPLADSCEFQTHYWALVFRHIAEDDSILDIAIPTVYFNYKQKVSGARIDFEMSEVKDISSKLAPIAQMEAGKILNQSDFKRHIEVLFGVEFTPMLTEINSIHKHPGASARQSFSGTDLDTSAEDHGVVFPIHTAKDNVPNFAGIMALDSKKNNTAHFEYRLVNGELGKDIKYKQGRCLAITIGAPSVQSNVEKLLGYAPTVSDTIRKKYADDFPPAIINALTQIYKELKYTPFTKAVRPENLERSVVKIPSYSKYDYTSWDQKTFYDLDESVFASPKKNGLVTKTPTRFTKIPDDIETKMRLQEKCPDFIEEAKLTIMSKEELISYLMELDRYYLDRPVSLSDYPNDLYEKKGDVIDEILEVQLNIIDELSYGIEEQ